MKSSKMTLLVFLYKKLLKYVRFSARVLSHDLPVLEQWFSRIRVHEGLPGGLHGLTWRDVQEREMAHVLGALKGRPGFCSRPCGVTPEEARRCLHCCHLLPNARFPEFHK